MLDAQIREAVALLRDDGLVWSPDFESIRLPLADLLEAIGRLPTHQLDDALDGLFIRLLCIEPDDKPAGEDALEAWIRSVAKTFRVL